MMESLTKLTQHFTSSAYEDVLSDQKVALEYKKKFGKFDAEEAREKASQHLINKKPIDFNNISPSLVYFEDKDSLSIITNYDKNLEEYKDLFELFNSNTVKNFKDLINYKSLNNEKK